MCLAGNMFIRAWTKMLPSGAKLSNATTFFLGISDTTDAVHR